MGTLHYLPTAEDANTSTNIGASYQQEKNFGMALKYFLKAYDLEPEVYQHSMNVYNMYSALGDYENALRYASTCYLVAVDGDEPIDCEILVDISTITQLLVESQLFQGTK